MDYKRIIESRYDRRAWQSLLYDIFKSKAVFKTTPVTVNANSTLVNSSFLLGTINLSDGKKIAIYEIKLAPAVDIAENRVGVRNLLLSDWKAKGCSGAFMFCYRDNESALRFSYVSEYAVFKDGTFIVERTNTKRFTYLLGEGHRSRTAIKQFETLKQTKLCLNDITDTFSIDALNDDFFTKYREYYDSIVEYVTGKRIKKVGKSWKEIKVHEPNAELMQSFNFFAEPEKAVRDYVKRLMGRIVFLQFVQKKGWLGVPVNSRWGSGDKEYLCHLYKKCAKKERFIEDYLNVLFDNINTPRANDLGDEILGASIKVPFLNGGLFNQDALDSCTFRLPDEIMGSLLAFFDSYNFTIDENSPDDEEFGIDPEMLGRIFESLLEDNKDKGIYFTRKEIVQYMCKESIISYLKKAAPDAECAIRGFVNTYNVDCLSEDLRSEIDDKLKSIKVCDPAIGSGAFPMGILKEIFCCRGAIEHFDKSAAIKAEIINNNIYGVDIDKGAIDIARLRFWLTIVVDETSPNSLPNMDFKVLQGDSLLERFNGVNLEHAIGRDEDLKQIQTAIHDFYSISDKSIKESQRTQIKNNIRSYIRSVTDNACCLCEHDFPSDKFFLWHTIFPEVFSSEDTPGFDIVIGNPPYGAKLTAEKKELYLSQSQLNSTETAILFIEKSLSLVNHSGIVSFIVPKAFTYASNYKHARNLVEPYISTIVDCGKAFDNVKLEQCIIINELGQDRSCYDNYVFSGNVFNYIGKINKSSKAKFGLYLNDVRPIEIQLAERILSKGKPMKSISSNSRGETIQGEIIKEGIYPVIGGNEIDKFGIRGVKGYVNSEQEGKALIGQNSLLFQNIVAHIMNPYPHVKLIGCIPNDKKVYLTDTINQIIIKTDYDVRYIWALLNSKLLSWYVYSFIYGKAIRTMHFDTVSTDRIPIIIDDREKDIVKLVDKLRNNKDDASLVSSFEDKLDSIIYKVYGLTYEEIFLIDPETTIDEGEYKTL